MKIPIISESALVVNFIKVVIYPNPNSQTYYLTSCISFLIQGDNAISTRPAIKA